MYRRTSRRLSLSKQCVVMFFGGLVCVRAYDFGHIAVQLAVAPLPEALLRPHVCQLTRSIASGVARVCPILPIEVKILRSKQVDRKWLYARRWLNRTRLWCRLLRMRHCPSECSRYHKHHEPCPSHKTSSVVTSFRSDGITGNSQMACSKCVMT